jgi:hypothetical protein
MRHAVDGHVSKETDCRGKRETIETIETHYRGKRDPTIEAKQTYYRGKRDLL